MNGSSNRLNILKSLNIWTKNAPLSLAAGAPPQTLCILGPHNDLLAVGDWMIKNRNFHRTQFPGYTDKARYGRL